MADESSVVPIWCDVGKNLNAVSLVVSLGRFTKRATTNGGRSKQIVRIYAQKLTCDNHEDVNRNQADSKNTVHYPGKSCPLSVLHEMVEVSMVVNFLNTC